MQEIFTDGATAVVGWWSGSVVDCGWLWLTVVDCGKPWLTVVNPRFLVGNGWWLMINIQQCKLYKNIKVFSLQMLTIWSSTKYSFLEVKRGHPTPKSENCGQKWWSNPKCGVSPAPSEFAFQGFCRKDVSGARRFCQWTLGSQFRKRSLSTPHHYFKIKALLLRARFWALVLLCTGDQDREASKGRSKTVQNDWENWLWKRAKRLALSESTAGFLVSMPVCFRHGPSLGGIKD